MFFKGSASIKESLSGSFQGHNTRPSSFNKQNRHILNDVTPIESRISTQSNNFRSLNQSTKIFKQRPTTSTNNYKFEDFLKKVSNYLTISNVLIEEAQSFGNTSGTLLRQIKKLGDRIQTQMQDYKGISTMDHSQEIEGKIIQQQLIKRIKQLQQQVQRLQSVVEETEEVNLKMMIKINQNQSGNIAYFKTQLQQSFQAYKNLEDKVKIYKQKLKQMQNIKTLVEKDNQKKSETISFLQKQVLKNPKDRRASLNESKVIKGVQQRLKQKVRYPDRSMNSITSSITSNYLHNNSNNNSIGNSYLKCVEDIQQLQNFISH